MSLPRYPKYKDSGVEWLGHVPEHWEVAPLKRGFEVRLGKMLQPNKASPSDELVPYLRAANIQWSGVDLTDLKQMWVSAEERQQLSLQPNDLLISEGGDVGRSALWKSELDNCYFQNSINRVRGHSSNSTQFLYYWLSMLKASGYIEMICNKSTIAHFTAEKVSATPVALPPITEQQAIVDFLESHTTQIDRLVAEQEKLISLLNEKRQALISQAVTKGLDPHVRLKDSGVEWLGHVPEHWTIKAMRHVARIRNGTDFKRIAIEEGGYPVYGSGGEFARVSSFIYDKPSVLLGRKGTIDKPLYIDHPFWTVDTMFYTEIQPSVSAKFLYYFCKTIPFAYFEFGSALPSMTQNDFDVDPIWFSGS